MLRVANDLSAFVVGAGEAFLFEVQLVDSNNAPSIDIPDEGLVLTFYEAGAATAHTVAIGARRFDAGEYFRWVWPGTFTQGLVGRQLRVELARRYREGKAILATGSLRVDASAPGVPSLAGVAIGDVVTRATFRMAASIGAPPTITISQRAWDEGPITPPAYAIRNGDVVALML